MRIPHIQCAMRQCVGIHEKNNMQINWMHRIFRRASQTDEVQEELKIVFAFE